MWRFWPARYTSFLSRQLVARLVRRGPFLSFFRIVRGGVANPSLFDPLHRCVALDIDFLQVDRGQSA